MTPASAWNGRIVSESTLISRINAARRAIGDDGDQQCLIRTVARKGVRFVGKVQGQSDSIASSDLARETPIASLAPLDRPSIVVRWRTSCPRSGLAYATDRRSRWPWPRPPSASNQASNK
jgi:hypothetical protein